MSNKRQQIFLKCVIWLLMENIRLMLSVHACVYVWQVPAVQPVTLNSLTEVENYEVCRVCVEELALYLKPISGAKGVCVGEVLF